MNSKYVPMTDDDIQDLLNIGNPDEAEYQLIRFGEQAVLARIAEQGLVIVPVTDCPNCNNDGAYYDNYGQVHQCQWCYEMPHSRFNQKQATVKAINEE